MRDSRTRRITVNLHSALAEAVMAAARRGWEHQVSSREELSKEQSAEAERAERKPPVQRGSK